jgi:hypothetical protein
MRKIPFALLKALAHLCYSAGMIPKEAIEPESNCSSSKQGSNSASALPALPAISARLGKLLSMIARKLGDLDNLIEKQAGLQTITLVIKLDKRGRPRTILTRTESKSELST